MKLETLSSTAFENADSIYTNTVFSFQRNRLSIFRPILSCAQNFEPIKHISNVESNTTEIRESQIDFLIVDLA